MPASQLTALTFSIIDEDLLEDLLEDRLDEDLTKKVGSILRSKLFSIIDMI